MSTAAATANADSDILCEQCGYILNGLPQEGNCPECGTAVALSTAESGRKLPAWEDPADSRPTRRRFAAVTFDVILRPTLFYRTLKTRAGEREQALARTFGLWHLGLTAGLGAAATVLHYTATQGWLDGVPPAVGIGVVLLATGALAGPALLVLSATVALAARLTAWEAAWRGLRLPPAVVRRGLDYHAAAAVPAALTIFAIVAAYRLLLLTGALGIDSLVPYLYVLSGAIVLAAGYLFWTYWIAMKNMLYANV